MRFLKNAIFRTHSIKSSQNSNDWKFIKWSLCRSMCWCRWLLMNRKKPLISLVRSPFYFVWLPLVVPACTIGMRTALPFARKQRIREKNIFSLTLSISEHRKHDFSLFHFASKRILHQMRTTDDNNLTTCGSTTLCKLLLFHFGLLKGVLRNRRLFFHSDISFSSRFNILMSLSEKHRWNLNEGK